MSTPEMRVNDSELVEPPVVQAGKRRLAARLVLGRRRHSQRPVGLHATCRPGVGADRHRSTPGPGWLDCPAGRR